ncbi:MAG: ATP synthase F1 subunit gamma [Bacillota bacterium]|nr:ATP synthase F1 subunit gamma [Bacillota bacterium]
MEELRDLRRRIRSVRGTQQITRAMSLVASTRLRRIERLVDPARTYAGALRRIVVDIAARTPPWAHPLLKPAEVAAPAYLVITSDRGLAGGYNAEILRLAMAHISRVPAGGRGRITVMAAGRKGRDFFRRRGLQPAKEYVHLPDTPDERLARRMAEDLLALYVDGRIDSLHLVFGRFMSRGSYRPDVIQLLPVEKAQQAGYQDRGQGKGEGEDEDEDWDGGENGDDGQDRNRVRDVHQDPNPGGERGSGREEGDGRESHARTDEDRGDFDLPLTYEPSPESVLDRLFPHYLVSVVYAALVEAKASELAARTIAMDSATDNAGELMERLTLTYNRARQAEITQEISEIATGAESLR